MEPLRDSVDVEGVEAVRAQWCVAISAGMPPFGQKCHADPVEDMAGCKPCKWYLAAAIKRTESIYNQGDLKPPITHQCLWGHRAPACSNMQGCPSLLIRQELLGHPGVSRLPLITSSGTLSRWPVWL